ncbi:unnamed protein product [Effrenium voratum]|nr:unnamed protein product [Effrenium voratum]
MSGSSFQKRKELTERGSVAMADDDSSFASTTSLELMHEDVEGQERARFGGQDSAAQSPSRASGMANESKTSIRKLGAAAVLVTALASVLVTVDTTASTPRVSSSRLESQTIPLAAPPRDLQVVIRRFMIWQSAQNTGDRLTRKWDGELQEDFPFSGPTVEISNEAGQIIEGFGGAFTEAAAMIFRKLSPDQKSRFLEDYFHLDGLGYVLGRTHINSCDFSIGSYSFDDTDGDVELKKFDTDLTRDKENLIPLIWAAQYMVRAQGRELKMLASPWSPPAWMKNQTWNPAAPTMDHSGSPCLKEGMESVWAKYMAKWVASYKAHGIPIWAMTVQNEPENNASWEACLFTADEEADFVAKHLGPVMRNEHPEVQIYAFDHNKDHVYEYATKVLNNKDASQYLTGIAYHWYSGDGWDNLQKLQDELQHTGFKLLGSEATWEAYRWKKGTTLAKGDWSFGEGYAHDIIGDLNRGAVGWLDWNLILDEKGGPNHVNNVCDAAMQVNFTTKEVYRHPQFYYIGHFSKFFLPGSVHLGTTVHNSGAKPVGQRPYGVCTADDGIEATAVRRPNGQVAVVVLNCGDVQKEFKLKYTSLAAKLVIPAHGVQTFLFQEIMSI